MKRISKIVFLSLVCSIVLWSCQRNTCDEVIPELSYKTSFIQGINSDSITLTFEFKDCDGDIGHDTADTIFNNLQLRTFYLENNIWQEVDTSFFDSQIPVLEEDGNKLIEGEIDKLITGPDLLILDTFRFEVVLIDRAYNRSNTVVTPSYSF